MTSELKATPGRKSPDEPDRGDKSALAEMFRRLVSLAAEIFPGQSTRLALETRLGLPGTRISKDVRYLEDLGIEVTRSGHKYVIARNEFPVLVSREESEALLLAHQVLLKAGLPEEEKLRSLLDRIPTAIRTAAGEDSEGLGAIDFPPALIDSRPFVDRIDRLRRAIRSGHMFTITYESQRARRGGESSRLRKIDRAELVFIGTIYLNGWEVMGDGEFQARTFRLDRITDIKPLASVISKPSPPKFEYVYRLSAAMAEMASRPPGATTIRLPDGRLEIRTTAKTELLARMNVLRYGADAEVVEPESLRLAVAEALRKGAALYDRPDPLASGE